MDLRVEGVAGGIARLQRLLREHEEAVARDLLCAGLRIEWLGTEALSWYDLHVFVKHAPDDSAIVRATDPDAGLTTTDFLLRRAVHELEVLVWQRTENGSKGRNYPTPLPLTKAERDAAQDEAAKNGDVKFDAVSRDEMARVLGWEAVA